jgi:putative hemolysin
MITIGDASRTAGSQRKNELETPRYRLKIAQHADEIEAAQRLRYEVFFADKPLGVAAPAATQLDIDEYDVDCEHLIVIEETSAALVGCYRIMRPEAAQRRGAFYADGEFDLTRLRGLRGTTVEVGRACIHPDYRAGSVIMLL